MSTVEIILEIAAILIKAGVPQELAHLLATGIHAAVLSINAMNTPYSVVGVVSDIIRGVDKDWADKPGPWKRQEVADAVSQYITNHGGVPDQKGVDTLVQLAVNALLGPNPPAA